MVIMTWMFLYLNETLIGYTFNLDLREDICYPPLPFMTDEEKFKAIVERLNAEGWCNNPLMISVMVISHYLTKMQDLKLLECEFKLTENADKVLAVIEEFDWKPSDRDVYQFVNEMVDEEDREAFFFLIKRFRDDKNGLISEIEQFRKNNDS